MKKRIKIFGLSFFSHSLSREGVKRGYTGAFVGFVLALAFMWAAFVGGEMLPFSTHYNGSDGFRETVHLLLASDGDSRIEAKIEDGRLKVRRHGGEYAEGLIVNTLESAEDKLKYSSGDCSAVIDSRPANTLAEVEAYCVSNDGKNTEISYADYLTLSSVARLNFDFRLRYTGNALTLDDATVAGYRAYLDGLSAEAVGKAAKLDTELSNGEITKDEYNRKIYEAYFENYYPEISAYESSSKVPLLRNYYYHNYISQGIDNYIFIFDDYLTGSYKTGLGGATAFYGFYSSMEDGELVSEGMTATEAAAAADSFIKESFGATFSFNAYAYFMNTVTIAPFIALMLMVATLLGYSLLRLKGVESISSLGAMLKVIGSYLWFSGAVSALLTVATSFLVRHSIISALPPVIFFITLVTRSVIFVIMESKVYKNEHSEPKEAE